MGGKAFVPEVNGEACKFTELGGKVLNLSGLWAGFAGELERISDHDANYREAPAEAGERPEIFARTAAPLEGKDGLRCESQLVGDGDADALRSNIECKISGRPKLVCWQVSHI
jgi:hypothetical protein